MQKKLLTIGMYSHTMHTMKQPNRNPVIRVYPHTRKKLKVLAAQAEETMQEIVERLAQAEIERLEKGRLDAALQKDQTQGD